MTKITAQMKRIVVYATCHGDTSNLMLNRVRDWTGYIINAMVQVSCQSGPAIWCYIVCRRNDAKDKYWSKDSIVGHRQVASVFKRDQGGQRMVKVKTTERVKKEEKWFMGRTFIRCTRRFLLQHITRELLLSINNQTSRMHPIPKLLVSV